MEIKASGSGWIAIEEISLDDDSILQFAATEVRMERTGPHGKVGVYVNKNRMASDTINIDKMPQRIALAGAAIKQIESGNRGLIDRPKLTRLLDTFCDELWEAWSTSTLTSKLLEGDLDVPPIRLLMDNFVAHEAGTTLYGPPGKGKSNILLLWLVHLDAGDEIPEHNRVWQVKERRRVYFCNLERGEDSIRARLGRINALLGLPSNRPIRYLHAKGRRLSDIELLVQRDIRSSGCDFFGLDSLSRTGYGSMVKDDVANEQMDALNRIAPFGWAAIGHTARANDEHVYGSQMFTAAADIEVQLKSEQKGRTLGIALRVTKANDLSGGLPPSYLALEFDEIGLTRVRRAQAGEFATIAGDSTRPLETRILDYLMDVAADSATNIAKELGEDRTTVAKILGNKVLFVRIGKKAGARDVLYKLIEGTEE